MKMKNQMAALLSVLAVLLLLPMGAMAAGNIDAGRNVSLALSCKSGNTPLSDEKFELYLVASVNEACELTVTETFRKYHVDIQDKSDDGWKALASTLEGYVLRDGLKPADSGRTDRQGLLTFPCQAKRLEQGLYLVLGQCHTQDGRIYQAAPFMVLLPARDPEAGNWLYDVAVKPKQESRPESDGGTVTRKVLKVWADDGHEKERPKKVIVQLLRDGKVYDTVTLNAANSWRHTWTGLKDCYQWNIVEQEPEDYTVTATREGITFVVTNTYTEDTSRKPTPNTPAPPTQPGKSVKSTLPQTGQLWWPVPVLLAAGMLFVAIGLIRRRGAADENE